MITTEEKGELKARLEKERDLLEAELLDLGAQNPRNPADWVPKAPEGETFGADRNDNADIIEEMHENTAAMNELEVRLQNVRLALEKFENGTYGVCEISGGPIEIERLRANPAARTCLAHMNDPLP